ncbi:MAG: tRNA lysidine(34) synthetase TilS [Cyanobacteria bacterium QS_4_48_99]|nr:MAG: tRNA lysidine(34) synthetase TilS [Cyanobacteria bacterium QS_4_48_99]
MTNGTKQNWTLFHARLHRTLRQWQLLPKGQSVLVAVSGGQDSLCLLKLLWDLQPKWKWQVAIAHCDHRWSSDTGIADHVRQIAQGWDLPFYLKTANQLRETEAAAREWRYQALTEIAQARGFSILVTAHTKSDRAETLLYNLIRGAGTEGLQALTWQRPLTSNIQLVRPLLNFSRAETYQFCQQFQLPIWDDAANQNLNYARSRIRAHVIPYLQTHFNPQFETALAQTAEVLRAEVEYLEDTASQIFQQATTVTVPEGLNRTVVRSAPLALQRRVMRRFLQQILSSAPTFEQIEELTHLINAPNRSRTSSLPTGATDKKQRKLTSYAEVEGDWILVKNQE